VSFELYDEKDLERDALEREKERRDQEWFDRMLGREDRVRTRTVYVTVRDPREVEKRKQQEAEERDREFTQFMERLHSWLPDLDDPAQTAWYDSFGPGPVGHYSIAKRLEDVQRRLSSERCLCKGMGWGYVRAPNPACPHPFHAIDLKPLEDAGEPCIRFLRTWLPSLTEDVRQEAFAKRALNDVRWTGPSEVDATHFRRLANLVEQRLRWYEGCVCENGLLGRAPNPDCPLSIHSD
jgi:hypothetical protein